MGVGEDMKASVDSIRNALGVDCTLNDETPLGKCSFAELNPSTSTGELGFDFSDEIGFPWAMIEAAAGSGVKTQDRITVDVTGQSWIVRRVLKTLCAGVVIGERCLCVGKNVDA
jgi:hypothetical protein